MNVNKDTVIGDILMTKPEAIGTLMSFGMGCVMCPASQTETLEEACLVHGMQVEPLVEAINNIKKED
ncbi:DUF1858 domain-containing protein [Peptoniphilus stercorisuis]|uniref:Hybrid cluster-associated redox disulfide protein n=1 Tax=Peptoniphilus stercorisuis TaxID=1436965 RepID=A0ABS4KC80_9FIRM|nr:DUF1858 domain-containing protein [Peptoniphilus stercorisuis]MBP2025375.1 hybrid cluster-associated redox disulfide protein [Peptoniphilus stercorisuis]